MIPRWISKYWPVLLIAAAVFLFFRQPLFLGKSFCIVDVTRYLPWKAYRADKEGLSNVACNDQVFAHYPRKTIYHKAIRSGKLPQWSERMMGGFPVSADPHFGWYDPLHLIFAIFSVDTALKLSGFLQWFLGGVFAFLFLREIGLGRMAAVVGGVAFFTQPFFITHLAMPANLQSAIWLPYLLWIFERMMKSPRPGMYVPALALGVFLSIVGGFPPTFILVLASAPLYGICRITFGSGDNAAVGGRRAAAAALIVSIVIGAVLAAPQLLPTYRISQYSERRMIPYEAHKKVTLPIEFLATLADPYILGRPTKGGWGGFAERIRPGAQEWVSPTNFLEDNHYVGWATLLLAIWAIRFRWRDRKVKIMALTAALALVTLYGAPTLRLAYYLIPGFASARPDRIIFVWGSFMAFLAAVGFDELAKGKPGERKRFAFKLLIAVSVIAIIPAIAGFSIKFFPEWIGERLHFSISETGRVAAYKYMVAFALGQSPTWSLDAFYAASIALVSALLILAAAWRSRMALILLLALVVDADLMAGRYLTWQTQCYPEKLPGSIEYLVNHGQDRRMAHFEKKNKVFPDNAPLIWGLSDAQGRQALMLRHWGRYFESIEPGAFWRRKKVAAFKKSQSLASPLINAAGIKYLLSDVPDPFPISSSDRWKLVHSGDVYIYENLEVFPEAWLATKAVFASDEQQAAKLIANPGFDPALTVVIEGERTGVKGNGGKAEVRRHSGEKVEIRLSEGASGWLVLADTWYPAWRAFVDGKPRKIHKADLAFMAVQINPGDEAVVFEYRDISVWIGWLLAAFGVMGSLLIWLMSRKKRAQVVSQ